MTQPQMPLSEPFGEGEPMPSTRVLVVDDEPAILFAYCRLMEREGIAVDSCTDLQGAKEHVQARPYMAVITDLRLAGTDNRDGLEVVRFVRQAQPETKLICATGYGCDDVEQQLQALGVSHYFEKPVAPAVILKLLKGLRDGAVTAIRQLSASCCWLAMLGFLSS
jgi:DNA-binding NtrC family response regulator